MTDAQNVLSMLTCDYADGPVLYAVHVLMLMCRVFAPLLVAHGPLFPLMIGLEYECRNLSPVQRSPSFSMASDLVGFPFVILDRYNAPSCAMSYG